MNRMTLTLIKVKPFSCGEMLILTIESPNIVAFSFVVNMYSCPYCCLYANSLLYLSGHCIIESVLLSVCEQPPLFVWSLHH